MLDDFFTRALVAGIGIAIIAGPFGCFIVWQRLSYFGDTLAHSGLLGIALAYLFQVNITASIFTVCGVIAVSLFWIQRHSELASDAILGLLSHASLALGLLVISLLASVRIDLMGLLFGDILSVSTSDIILIYGCGALALVALFLIWRPLFAITVSRELADAEGINTSLISLAFMLLLSLVIALAMKLVGVLLITAMLIVPAAAARSIAKGPVAMMVSAVLIGMAAVVFGLTGSLTWDTPSGPSIVVAAVVLFALCQVASGTLKRYRHSTEI